jgi:hypothetical protein
MCMEIDDSVTSLNKRTVWKVFDKAGEGSKGTSARRAHVEMYV